MIDPKHLQFKSLLLGRLLAAALPMWNSGSVKQCEPELIVWAQSEYGS